VADIERGVMVTITQTGSFAELAYALADVVDRQTTIPAAKKRVSQPPTGGARGGLRELARRPPEPPEPISTMQHLQRVAPTPRSEVGVAPGPLTGAPPTPASIDSWARAPERTKNISGAVRPHLAPRLLEER
jgi:hypothetical protein